MIARTHDLAAITALSVVLLSVPMPEITLSTVVLAIIANLIGGIAPDIDQPTAPFWRNLPVGGFFGRFLTKMLGGHRFLTHSLLGVIALGYLVYLMLSFFYPVMPTVNIDVVWWAFMIGILSHLIVDTFNKEGVPWLLPIPIKIGLPPVKAWRVTTDSWAENWVVFPGLIIFNIVFLSINYNQIVSILHKIIE
jgi:inner membrane protein